MLVGIERLALWLDTFHAFLGEHVEHLLEHHAYPVRQVARLAGFLSMGDRALEVVESREHLHDDALSGPLDRVFLFASHALAVVVELRLQSLRGLEVTVGLLACRFQFGLKLVAPELELGPQVLFECGVGRIGRGRWNP